MKLLQAHDDSDWAKMTEDYNSSEEDENKNDDDKQV